MANLVPLIALAAGAFFLLKRDRTEGLFGHGLKPGIHDVKVGETLVLHPTENPKVEAVGFEVLRPGPDGDEVIATAEYFMAVVRGRKKPEVTFLKPGVYQMAIEMSVDIDVGGPDVLHGTVGEYGFNVSE